MKLVSNQPVSKSLECALSAAHEYLNGRPSRTANKTLLDELANEERAEIKRLFSGCGLRSYAFTDFLRVLDLSDCGEQSRFAQKIELVKELGRYGTLEIQTQYRDLKGLILDRMMPESRNIPPLAKHDILPIFGFSTYRSAYPAEPKFELPYRLFKRKETPEFAQAVLFAAKPVCLHSGGGKGKTILVHISTRRNHEPIYIHIIQR